MDLLLKNLLRDEKKQNKILYSSGEYWSKKNLKTLHQLKKYNLNGFRGLYSGVGTSFVDNLVTNVENELNIFGRLAFNFFKLPFLKHLHKEQVKITLSHIESSIAAHSILYRNSPLVKKLISKYKFVDTVNYGCCQKFSYNNKDYSFLYLEIANRIENFSKFLDYKSFHSFFEIGGGFGANIDFIISNFPNIKKIIYLDAVPNIYVGTMYLKYKYKNAVKDYLSIKNLSKIRFSDNNNLEIICIAPWQIERLDIKLDHFHNASSFVEMPKVVIENYIKNVLKLNPETISLLTYKFYDPKTTIDPYSLNNFFEKKLETYEFSTVVPDLERKDIYFLKK